MPLSVSPPPITNSKVLAKKKIWKKEGKGKNQGEGKCLSFRLLCASTGWETFLIIKALTPESVQLSAASAIQRLLSPISYLPLRLPSYQLPATCCLTSPPTLSAPGAT